MKSLRNIRIILAIGTIVAAVLYAFTALSDRPMAQTVKAIQIVPSMLATTFGVCLIWLVISLIVGRVYCASFCPIGILQDLTIRLRRILGKPPRWRFRPRRRVRMQIFLLYLLCLVVGLMIVPWLIEPWNIFLDVASAVKPTDVEATWLHFGISSLVGLISGSVVLLLILIWAWLQGREYCNVVCPIGTALALTQTPYSMHIAIDPNKCISCLKCEDICRGHCIKVVSRYVDNTRCVRCFDCINVCPNEAITFRGSRIRPMDPLSQRIKSPNT